MSTTETKVTHTPGPWFVERAGRNPRVLAKPKGFRSTPENPVFVVTNNVYISADKDEATANAHVIAAAPDMLEALEQSVEIIDALLLGQIPEAHRYSETSRAATIVHDAITKARGVK